MPAENPFQSVEQVENLVNKLKLFEAGSPEYIACVVLMTANSRGAEIQAIASFTGYDRRLLTEIDENCRRNRIWVGESTDERWFDGDGKQGLDCLLLDVAVALGRLERREAPPIQ